MMDILRYVLTLFSGLFASFYVICAVLFAMNNQLITSKLDTWFPVLARMNLSRATTLGQFLIWSLILPIVTIGIFKTNALIMCVAMSLSVVEVYLGATFYFEIGDTFGGWLHIILHSVFLVMMGILLHKEGIW
jgi:hypothetical protein